MWAGWEGKEELNMQSGNERNNSKDKHSSIKQNAMGTFTHGGGGDDLQLLHYYWIQPKAENLFTNVGWNHTLWPNPSCSIHNLLFSYASSFLSLLLIIIFFFTLIILLIKARFDNDIYIWV